MANCPAMRPTFTTGTPERVGEHDRHLQDDLELVADGVGGEGVERLGAVAGLQQERLARRPPGRARSVRLRASPANTSGGSVPRCLSGGVEGGVVGPVRLLGGRPVAPRRGGPGLGHGTSVPCRAAVERKAGCRKSTGRPRRVGRPIGQEAGRAGGATASDGRAGGCGPASRPSCTRGERVPTELRQEAGSCCQAASLRARACSRTAVTARFTRRRAASAVTPSSSPTSR